MQTKLKLALVVAMAAAGVGASVVPSFAACAALPTGAPVVSPGDLLRRFPAGGGGLVSEVRNMVATNPGSVDGIAGLLPGATPAQKEAIGAGLGQAAGLCTRQEPASARRIQEAVLGMNSPEVSQAFQTVTGDRQTAATGGGGGAGGGAGGGGGGGGGTGVPNTATSGASSPYVPASTSTVSNPALAFSAGSAVSAGLTTSRLLSGTTTTTTTSPVSVIAPAGSPLTNASQNSP